MTIIGFEEIIQARIRPVEKKKILKIIRKNRTKYFNESHFLRVAIIKLIKEEERKWGWKRIVTKIILKILLGIV